MTAPSSSLAARFRWIGVALLSTTIVALSTAAAQDSQPPTASTVPASPAADEKPADTTASTDELAAQSAINAVVLEISGKVRARDAADAEWRPLAVNDSLRAGAEVQSGLRSHAALRLGRNATILLDAGTTVVIPELRQDDQVLVTRTAVKAGRADMKVDRVGLQNDFRVVTPSATIAVAGTGLGVQAGRLVGTEIVGARLNEIAAIEARWIARRLAYFFGHGTSSSLFPDPAEGAIDESVRRNLMPGVVDGREQLEQAWANGSLQNVVFNLNNLQRLMNLDASIFDDELATVAVLAQLLEIRAATGGLAEKGQGAAMLAAAFAQKAVQLSSQATAMLPSIEQLLAKEAATAEDAAAMVADLRKDAEGFKSDAFAARDDALFHLAETILAIAEKDHEKAKNEADLAAAAALMANMAASQAMLASRDAQGYAMIAANAAATAQSAINDYFAKVGQIDLCAADAAAQAAIAENAALASAALESLADQLALAIQDNAAAGILADIGANTAAAAQAAASAAASRDEALAAASNARTMGERVLFNWAAVYASQAAADAAAAQAAASSALEAALEARDAALLAHELAYGNGKGGGKGGD